MLEYDGEQNVIIFWALFFAFFFVVNKLQPFKPSCISGKRLKIFLIFYYEYNVIPGT